MAKGNSATEAYVSAGYKPNRQNAHRLTTKDDIRRRVEELTSKAAEKAEWTAADRLAALKRISDRSEKEDARVAVSAISEANKMQGSHAAAKLQHSGQVTVVSITPEKLSQLSNDELAALEQAYPVLEKLGLVAAGDQGGEADQGGEPED